MEKIKRHRRTKSEMNKVLMENEIINDVFSKTEKRGRPSKEEFEQKLSIFHKENPDKFLKSEKEVIEAGLKPKIYETTQSDGSIWYYDWNKNPINGLVSTTPFYPKDFDFSLPDDNTLPLTKRQWLNSANGKYVGYGRAKQLGLISEELSPKTGKRGRPKKA